LTAQELTVQRSTYHLTMADTRWLNDRERAAWRAFRLATLLLDGAVDRQLQRDADMPAAYYAILVGLSEQPDRTLRMGDLASWMNYSQSRLSHAITRLERSGWVIRRPDPDDRRATLASLTDAGYAALVDAAPGHTECVREYVFDQLTETQVEQLREICEGMLVKLRASREACPPEDGSPT
jgi:DNA-binding MarR family transcriptional regulator